jgi:hypothetical protein
MLLLIGKDTEAVSVKLLYRTILTFNLWRGRESRHWYLLGGAWEVYLKVPLAKKLKEEACFFKTWVT